MKIFLGIGAIFIGWLRMKMKGKERKQIRSLTAITWLLILAIGGIWLVSMRYLTVVTAQEIYDDLYNEGYALLKDVERCGEFNEFFDKNSPCYGMHRERPDWLEEKMLEAIDSNTNRKYSTAGKYGNELWGRSKVIREIDYPVETAVLFYDGAGKRLFTSEDDIMFFEYYTREEWEAGMDTVSGLHYGWIDISEGKESDWKDDPYLRFRHKEAHYMEEYVAIRVTGVFDGNELKPVKMHYVTDTQIQQMLESVGQIPAENEYSHNISELDRNGLLEWQLQFERSSKYNEDELVTVYIECPQKWNYEKKALTYNGIEYESLVGVAERLDFPSWADMFHHDNDFRREGIFELDQLLVFAGQKYMDDENVEYVSNEEPPTEFSVVTAARSNPLICAIKALRNIYLMTGMLALVFIMVVRSCIAKYLVQPVADIVECIEADWKGRAYREIPSYVWRETEKLENAYGTEREWRRMKTNEVIRLETALDYAKTAEENRRQMISNIAHELKTPLAIIHSYAEGLKEHIAEEKREKYLNVILAEAERSDAMVLEMLDLSRLEAGRVKLSRDDFSLTELTKAVFEKLQLVIQTKNLNISFEFPEECMLTADESRIAQVVENFASNAVKYTPAGGNIAVRILVSCEKTSFVIANDCQPFTDEALSKVWDSFYRVDEARSGGGTGLGLAIAKSVIELHGGSCSVRNTKTGVEFSFTI